MEARKIRNANFGAAESRAVPTHRQHKDSTGKEKMKKTTKTKTEKSEIAGADCKDTRCHVHGNLKTRGRVFEGKVIKKFHRRVVIEFERMVYVRKYERYAKSKTKIHARLPDCMDKEINVGDLIQVKECRPLSKIVHSVVIKKVKGREEK